MEEYRFIAGTLASDGNSLSGCAAPFFDGSSGTEYQLRDNLFERYSPNCFELRQQVPICFNHDEEKILGISPNTAKVWADSTGLRYEVSNLPDTSYVRDMKALIKAGTIQGSSVKMSVEKDQWHKEGDKQIRSITKAVIYHLSPVFMPAYTKTELNLRSYDEWKEKELMEIYEQRLNNIVAKVRL